MSLVQTTFQHENLVLEPVGRIIPLDSHLCRYESWQIHTLKMNNKHNHSGKIWNSFTVTDCVLVEPKKVNFEICYQSSTIWLHRGTKLLGFGTIILLKIDAGLGRFIPILRVLN